MKIIRIPSIVCILAFSLLMAHAALATDQQDILVALKTLPLLTTKVTSPATVAVIYDPASNISKADAEAIKSIFDQGLEAPGGVKLNAQLTAVGELSRLAGAKIAFLAHGLPVADYSAISAATSSAGVLTICTDIDCVKGNKCVLGVVSRPQVEVYYSPVAAEAANVSFASAFTMLAKQVGSM
jgi:hypothetical protein